MVGRFPVCEVCVLSMACIQTLLRAHPVMRAVAATLGEWLKVALGMGKRKPTNQSHKQQQQQKPKTRCCPRHRCHSRESDGEAALSEAVGGLCWFKDLLGAGNQCQTVAWESPINKAAQHLLLSFSPLPPLCLQFYCPMLLKSSGHSDPSQQFPDSCWRIHKWLTNSSLWNRSSGDA